MEDLLRQIVSESNGTVRLGGSNAAERWQGFVHAIRWDEPWVSGLLIFHLFMAVAVFFTRKRPNFQLTLFIFICGIVYFAERLNTFFRQNWKAYGWTQNYFDPRGVFITIMYSAPLLCIGGAQMLYALSVASDLMVKVKRKELQQARQANAAAASAAGGAVPAIAGGGEAADSATTETATTTSSSTSNSTRRRGAQATTT